MSVGLLGWLCVVPAVLAVGCAIAERGRPDLRGFVAMAVMAVGMVDTMLLGSVLLPTGTWVATYLVLAVAVGPWRAWTGRSPMALHRSLHLVVMGALTAVLPADHTASTHAMHDHAAMAADAATSVDPLVVLAVLVAVAFCVHAVRSGRRTAPDAGWRRGELATATMSVAAMAAMAWG